MKKTSVPSLASLVLGVSLTAVVSKSPAAVRACRVVQEPRIQTAKIVPFHFAGVRIASVEDPTGSTGATLFYFPKGAFAQYDARGGSVASAETTLLDAGSYSHSIDGIVFAGGSTMGLAAADGVRSVLFDQRVGSENFDFIPSIPSAVVYDFGGRIYPHQDPRAYPNHELGRDLMNHLSDSEFYMGRAGAGISTSCNKACAPVWGGQGMASGEVRIGKKKFHVMSAVVVNAVGDVKKGEASFTENYQPIRDLREESAETLKIPHGHKHNTTLSIIITDIPLSRDQLKRLTTMVHTSMGRNIFPFHALTDGDIQFAVTTGKDKKTYPDIEDQLGPVFAELMSKAILGAVHSSNVEK